jgi:hypothetical protein
VALAIAIALGHEPPHHDDPLEGPDSFLADHGFEYIDGQRTRRSEMIIMAWFQRRMYDFVVVVVI